MEVWELYVTALVGLVVVCLFNALLRQKDKS